jgi:HD superfamily phosphohydrolase
MTAKPSPKTIRDPVHGDILVQVEDLPLLDSPEMQRLRGVRQLGSAFHVYPGAQHSRFEHSLGTYHVAGRIIERIQANHRRDSASCRKISSREAAVVRAVALLHDVTHIPHGHAVEDQDGLFPRHDTAGLLRRAVSRGDLGRALRSRRILEPVAGHLTESSARRSRTPFLSLIANGPLGADMLDYLRRDAYFTGLRLDYDDRLVDYLKIDPKKGIVYVDLVKHNMDREDILTEIMNLLRSRYVSSERIYYHHAKLASDALISRAVELAIMGGLTRKDVSAATDSALLTLLREWSYDGHPLGKAGARASLTKLLDRYEQRQLLKRCFVISRPSDEKLQDALVEGLVTNQKNRLRIEGEIAKALNVDDPAEVIAYCPNKGMQLKEAGVPVRRARRGIRPLSAYQDEFPALQQLVEAYRDLWKLYVFIPAGEREDLVLAGRRVERILGRRFPGIKNEYRP